MAEDSPDHPAKSDRARLWELTATHRPPCAWLGTTRLEIQAGKATSRPCLSNARIEPDVRGDATLSNRIYTQRAL